MCVEFPPRQTSQGWPPFGPFVSQAFRVPRNRYMFPLLQPVAVPLTENGHPPRSTGGGPEDENAAQTCWDRGDQIPRSQAHIRHAVPAKRSRCGNFEPHAWALQRRVHARYLHARHHTNAGRCSRKNRRVYGKSITKKRCNRPSLMV